MSARRNVKGRAHEWTNFEMHTLLCLMAKGVHREKAGKRRRNEVPGRAKQQAYLEVATALNLAVHGKDYDHDISIQEVSSMIDKICEERKAIVGFNGYMDRASPGCMTRGLKRMWDRKTKFDFDGSKREWERGRREKEWAKYRIARRCGRRSSDNGEEAGIDKDRFIENIWEEADSARNIEKAAEQTSNLKLN